MKLKYIIFLLLACFSINYAMAKKEVSTKSEIVQPRYRIIIDNDFEGDPDGLFELVHHLLSPSVEIKGIIGSHLRNGDPLDNSNQTATDAVSKINEVLSVMKLQGVYPVYQGSNEALANMETPQNSDAANAIIKEAMSDDKRPLFLVCGAGLTDIASAYLKHPEIAKRLTLIWIGGPEYSSLATPPPGYSSLEYNLNIDINAVKVIFNKSDITLWQVPRNVYRQALISYAELITKVKTQGAIGKYLAGIIENIMKVTNSLNINIGETYILGDSPLVLLTALQSSFEADPSSSNYVLMRSPLVNDSGLYETNYQGRNIRVYNHIDTRLLFEDFFAKLALFNNKQ
jgi:purine nucleosidase